MTTRRRVPIADAAPPRRSQLPRATMRELLDVTTDVATASSDDEHLAVELARRGERDLAHEVTRRLRRWARSRLLDAARRGHDVAETKVIEADAEFHSRVVERLATPGPLIPAEKVLGSLDAD